MDEATIKLARRAVAWKGWWWMSGMLVTAGGMPSVRLFYMHGGVSGGWWAGSTSGERIRLTNDDMRSATPILTDPATRGCVLDILRQAWEPHLPSAWAIHVRPVAQTLERPAGWQVAGLDVGGGDWVYESEAAALVVALEDAPWLLIDWS